MQVHDYVRQYLVQSITQECSNSLDEWMSLWLLDIVETFIKRIAKFII